MDANARLASLREALFRADPSALWPHLLIALEGWPEDPSRAVAIDYAEHHILDWPDEQRRAPRRWGMASGPSDLWRLIRGVDLSHLELTDDDLRRFLHEGHLTRLRWLNLAHNHLTDRTCALLAMHPALDGLRWLDLSFNRIGPPGAVSLSRSAALQSLQTLRLRGNRIAADGLAAICSGPVAASLEHLDLADNNVGVAGAAALALAELPALATLDLSHNTLLDHGLSALARLQHAPALRSLTLTDNNVVADGAVVLARSPLAARLQRLDLGRNRLTFNALAQLLSDNLTELEHLGVSSCHIGDSGLHALLRGAAPLAPLRSLDLAYNTLTGASLDSVARWSGAPRLHTLRLDHNPLAQQGLRALLQTHLSALTHLSLQSCELTTAPGLTDLATRTPALQHLDLSANALDEVALLSLAHTHLRLHHLSLANAPLTRVTADAIARSSIASHLQRLDLTACRLDHHGARAIANADLQHLQHLELACNRLGADGLRALLHARLPQLAYLGVGFNRLGRAGGRLLASDLLLDGIERLDLSDNAVGDEGCIALAHSRHFHKLRALVLRNNNISVSGMRYLMRAQSMPALEELDLSNNAVGWRGIAALRKRTGLPCLDVVDLGGNGAAASFAAGVARWLGGVSVRLTTRRL